MKRLYPAGFDRRRVMLAPIPDCAALLRCSIRRLTYMPTSDVVSNCDERWKSAQMRHTLGSHSDCFILQRTLLRFWPLAEPGGAVKSRAGPKDKQQGALQG